MAVTVVIPAYNEEDRIESTLRQLEIVHISNPKLISCIVLVDDHSKDGTVERAMRYRRNLPLKIVQLRENVGKWGAIAAGLHRVNEGVVVVLDADGSIPCTEELLHLCGAIPRRVLVCGTRVGPGASVEGKSLLRSAVSCVYRSYVRVWYVVCGGAHPVQDMQCPLKAVHREDLVLLPVTKRFAGDVEFVLLCDVAEIRNVPVQFLHQRGSKVSVRAVLNMLVETPRAALRGRKVRKKYIQ
jgi:glycosyltransferase involved in cell wall biosynthesis